MKIKKLLQTKKVDLINKVKRLPNLPGVYHFYNKEGEIIYIGKAKDIKKKELVLIFKIRKTNLQKI